MFQAVSETLKQTAKNPRFLGADIGFFVVLHTWNQKLQYHPHLHCVAPKGGLSPDKTRWIAAPKNFFLPVRALSKVYRGKLLSLLSQGHHAGKLNFYGSLQHLSHPKSFTKLLKRSCKSSWVVYSKKPFGGPTQVLKYLSAYTHRIAISNHRLRTLTDTSITFSFRDSKNKSKKRLLTLNITQFTQRFMLHLLPKGFRRIRHYGFLATASKSSKLTLAKKLIRSTHTTHSVTKNNSNTCPKCSIGIMQLLQPVLKPHSTRFLHPLHTYSP